MVAPTMNTESEGKDKDYLVKLGRTWIELQQRQNANMPVGDVFWAHKELDALCDSDPSLGLQEILLILSMDSSEFNTAHLSAGPLEDLLVRHGVQVISGIELEAQRNPAFRKMLQGVWENDIDEDVWNRLQALVRSN
jgi:hypothetical protein